MAPRIPLLDNLTWDHPLVQKLQNAAIERVVDKVLPRPAAPPPDLVALDRISQTIGQIVAQHAKIANDGSEPTPNGDGAGNSPQELSEYLRQIGATDVDTGCLPCGRAHIGGTQAGLENIIEIAQTSGWDDPEVVSRLSTVLEELDVLLEYDWTPERIAKSPPEHRKALERYVPEVKALRDRLSPGGPAERLNRVSRNLKEALRFAREDGVDHPQARRRIAAAEATVDDIERYQLAPERLEEMSPEQAKWWEDQLKPLRRLRQNLHNATVTPEDLRTVAAGFGRMATEAYRPYVQGSLRDDLGSLTAYAADLRSRFKADTDKL